MRYEAVIEATRNEVLRLLKQQRATIEEALQTGGLLKSDQEDHQRRNLSREDAEFLLKALDEEVKKVERLEMTLAVIGTMKAGKSTTINALVGARVLPARNQPMTTLPTLIRHTPGLDEPVLTFSKTQPFDDAVAALKKALETKEETGELVRWIEGMDSDKRRLVDGITSGSFSKMRKRYEGADEIFEFLKLINDVSRLCSDPLFDLPSPLDEYAHIDEFPVIEVEFHHLKDVDGTVGGARFTLIDTPGPNEAGQTRLREILHEQLEKASAVLAVMDYTQLNSEADAEVRRAVLEAARRYPAGLFAFVNKFDLKGMGDMEREEVAAYVSQRLLDGHIEPSRVFPISSLYAYLAGRALREIAERGHLPDGAEAAWVADFGEKAFGPLWQHRIANVDEVRSSAEALWQVSLLQEPLQQVVRRAFSRAAFISLESAVEKMAELSERLTMTLHVRRGALDMDIQQVREHIRQLEEDLGKIHAEERHAQEEAVKLLSDLSDEIRDEFRRATEAMNDTINEFFTLGKQLEQARKQSHLNRKPEQNVIDRFLARVGYKSRPRKKAPWRDHVLEMSEVNTFESREEGRKFVNALSEAVADILDPLAARLEEEAAAKISSLEDVIQENWRRRLGPILEAAEQRLNEAFAVEMTFPKLRLKRIPVSLDKIAERYVRKKTERLSGEYYERRWYTLGLVKHRVRYSYEVDVYRVNTKRFGDRIARELEQRQQEVQKHLLRYVQDEISAEIESLFDGVSAYLERFRGDLLDSIADQRQEEEQLATFVEELEKALSKATQHLKEVTDARKILAEFADAKREADPAAAVHGGAAR